MESIKSHASSTLKLDKKIGEIIFESLGKRIEYVETYAKTSLICTVVGFSLLPDLTATGFCMLLALLYL